MITVVGNATITGSGQALGNGTGTGAGAGTGSLSGVGSGNGGGNGKSSSGSTRLLFNLSDYNKEVDRLFAQDKVWNVNDGFGMP